MNFPKDPVSYVVRESMRLIITPRFACEKKIGKVSKTQQTFLLHLIYLKKTHWRNNYCIILNLLHYISTIKHFFRKLCLFLDKRFFQNLQASFNISPVFHFYTTWKCQKTKCFLTFSGGIVTKHWLKWINTEMRSSNISATVFVTIYSRILFRTLSNIHEVVFLRK